MNRLIQYLKEAVDFFYQIFLNRELMLTLCFREFEKRYIRNFFGFVWAILDPLAFIIILYLVFGERYGNKSPGDIPFIVYLITGYIAYNFFNESIIAITISIKEHSFLLKKVNFRVAILPIVTMLSNLLIHGIVLVMCIVVIVFNHVFPTLYWLQIFYYLFAMSFFLVALGWLLSSIYLFFPDIKNIINIVTRILFFLTPIFWKMSGLPKNTQFVLKLNPIYYIVNGYRDSFLYNIGFWERPLVTLYFWVVCFILLIVGVSVFKKLRPHFADVVD